jgi:hypothetical protein
LESRSIFAPLSDVLAQFKHPLALFCLAVMVGTQLLGNYVFAAFSGPFPPGGHQTAELIKPGVTVAKYAVFMLVFFVLARKFGGSEGSAGKSNMLVWFVLMLLYFGCSTAAAKLPTLLPDFGQIGTRRLPATLSAISFAVRLLFFPVMIFIAAAVHQNSPVRPSQVLAFITARGISWSICFMLFGLVLAVALFAMPLGLSTASGVPPRGALFVIALVGIGGQLINMLFAIGAYRAMQAQLRLEP